MGKRKLIPLSLMMLCSLCFSTACEPKNVNTNIIATMGDNKLTAEDLYAAGLYDTTVAEHVYSVLEKALIQSSIPVTNAIKSNVEREVENWRRKIEENAALNSTDYEEDLKTALEEQNASSVEELIENKIYAKQLQYAKEKFLEEKSAEYTKAYIDANFLYHIGDIAISIGSSSTNTDLYNLTISSTEAKNIYGAFSELVSGDNYYTVAERYSGSDTSKDGGEVGIVTLNDTDITNELRFALIGYSSIIENKYSMFDLPNNEYSQTLNDIYTNGIQSIPYSYIKSLNDVYSTKDGVDTKYMDANNSFYYSSGGNSVSSSSKVYYRNIIFNNLLNTKTPKFITVSEEDLNEGVNAVKMNVLMPKVDSEGYESELSEQYVLTNDLGNPYVVFKDSKGLHILTIHKTPFADDIYDYYSAEVSEDDEVISYAEFGKNQEARLEEVKSFATKYITRNFGSNTGEEKLLSFEVFKYYLNSPKNGNFKIIDKDVEKMINQYMTSISALADTKVTSDYKGYYDVYSNLIWFRHRPEISKEVPILACLTKESDGNYGCIYKYGQGFSKHTPAGESEG